MSDKNRPPAMVDGESSLEIPFDEYSPMNAADVHQYVEDAIGPPTKETRCVEVDESGKVVAVYAADPDIDKPLFGSKNTIELHMDAVVNDTKDAKGVFPIKPVVDLPLGLGGRG